MAASRRQYTQYGTEFVGALAPYKIVLFELRRVNAVRLFFRIGITAFFIADFSGSLYSPDGWLKYCFCRAMLLRNKGANAVFTKALIGTTVTIISTKNTI